MRYRLRLGSGGAGRRNASHRAKRPRRRYRHQSGFAEHFRSQHCHVSNRTGGWHRPRIECTLDRQVATAARRSEQFCCKRQSRIEAQGSATGVIVVPKPNCCRSRQRPSNDGVARQSSPAICGLPMDQGSEPTSLCVPMTFDSAVSLDDFRTHCGAQSSNCS